MTCRRWRHILIFSISPFSPQLSWYQVTGWPSCDTGTPDLKRCQQYRYRGGEVWAVEHPHPPWDAEQKRGFRSIHFPFSQPSVLTLAFNKVEFQGPLSQGPQAGSTGLSQWRRSTGRNPKFLWEVAPHLAHRCQPRVMTSRVCGRWVERGPRLHLPIRCLSCRPPGHLVQNVLPSTTSMALLSRTFPSAREMCSPLWPSPR